MHGNQDLVYDNNHSKSRTLMCAMNLAVSPTRVERRSRNMIWQAIDNFRAISNVLSGHFLRRNVRAVPLDVSS